MPESPAARANLRPLDVLVAIDEKAVDSIDALLAATAGRPAGHSIEVTFLREGRLRKTHVLLGDATPAPEIGGAAA